MNEAVTPTQVVLASAGFAASLAVVVIGRAIRAHLRQQHPAIWKKFGFPQDDPFWAKPNDERQVISAQSELWHFVRSGEFKKLRDDRLELLVRRRRWLMRAAAASLLALFANVFAFMV